MGLFIRWCLCFHTHAFVLDHIYIYWTTLGYFCSLKTIISLLWYTFLFIAKFHTILFVLGIRKALWVPPRAELNTQSYRLRCCLGCFSLAVKRHCDQRNLQKKTWVVSHSSRELESSVMANNMAAGRQTGCWNRSKKFTPCSANRKQRKRGH